MVYRGKTPRERIESIMRMWAEGHVGSEIAAQLGITKNAVVGIVNRARIAGDKRAVVRQPANSRADILCLPPEQRAEHRRRREEERQAKKIAQLAERKMQSIQARRERVRAMAAVEALAKERGAVVPVTTADVIDAHQREMAEREARERVEAEASERQRKEEAEMTRLENIQRIRCASEGLARIAPPATQFKPRKPGLCQWIEGDTSTIASTLAATWCGDEAVPGCSWCAAHMKRVFAQPRQPAAAQNEEVAA